ncbi:MAG: hypothetical protein L3K15_06565 [Thermoplasmata archaeon]|nr:hypothetical protein [Thermoplasmata archaeon]
MRRIMSRWTGLLAAASILLIVGSASAHITPSVTTYTVLFKETGLPASTSWTVTFNSVANTGTAVTHTFASISAGGYYWSVTTPVAGATGIQYVPVLSATYMYVPGQTTEVVQFVKQEQVTFSISPAASGSTTPSGAPYVNDKTALAISAIPAAGYAFSTWTSSTVSITLASATTASTVATITGTGTVTAVFVLAKYPITFTEQGLTLPKAWSVTFNGHSYPTSHQDITIFAQTAGYYSWSVGTVPLLTTGQYVPTPSSGYMSVPSQKSQTIVFVKQYQLMFAVTPLSSGSTTPSSTAFYNAGTNLSIAAQGTSTTVFSHWSSSAPALKIGTTTSDATNVSIGAPGTLTATFTTTSPCSTTCSVKFWEQGLPTGTAWGITTGSVFYGSTTSSVTISGLPSTGTYLYWSTTSPLGSAIPGVAYVATPTSGSVYVPWQTQQMIVFQKNDYVNVVVSPTGSGPGVGPASGWFPDNSYLAIWGVNYYSTWTFSSWSTNTSKLTLTNAGNASTFVKIKGPGTVTGIFVQPLSTVTFTAFGLPAATVWGLTFDSVLYLTSLASLVISSVTPASHYWVPNAYVAGAAIGTAYYTATPAMYMTTPSQTVQAIPFVKVFQVTFVASNTGTATGGSVNPNGNGLTAWYPNGTVQFVWAVNGSVGAFTTWSSSSPSITIASTTSAATTVTIKGAGTVTGKFA